MALFVGEMQKHLQGHKDLTAHKEVLECPVPAEVAIPLVHGNAKIECLVKEGDQVKIGDLIGKRDDHFYVPFFASVSGNVKAIEKRMGSAGKPVDHVVIENDGLDTFADLTTLNYENANSDEIIEFIKNKGILGCGGAGFPTYFKYKTDDCHTLIVNCVECEPYITADLSSIEVWFDDFKDGVKALYKASKASECILAVKKDKVETIALLNQVAAEVNNCKVVTLKDAYPMGWERTLVYETLGKRYDKLPIEVNAIVSNATTIIMCAQAMKQGTPIYKRIVTVSGNAVKEPHNVMCRVGTSVADLINVCGGYSEEEISLIAGGPMMGSCLTKDSISVSSISNAFTVLKAEKYDEIACLRCGKCVEHCPSGLQPVNIANAFKCNDVDRLETLRVVDCVECGTCTYVCPSYIHMTDNMRKAKRLMTLKKA